MEEPSTADDFYFKQDKARQNALRDLMEAAAAGKETDEALKQVKHMLTLGYDTEDNRNAMDRLKFAKAGKFPSLGLTVGEPPVLLSDILWTVEGMPIPNEVQTSFPQLKQDEWEAAIRTIILILTTYEV